MDPSNCYGVRMAIRYKTTTLDGKPILSHRKVWIQHHGEIPPHHHVHHKNGDRFDNRIENLELVHAREHAKHHTGHTPWNKGTAYGDTDAYARSNDARRRNYALLCAETHRLWRDGRTKADVAALFGVTVRCIYSRLQSHRQHRADERRAAAPSD